MYIYIQYTSFSSLPLACHIFGIGEFPLQFRIQLRINRNGTNAAHPMSIVERTPDNENADKLVPFHHYLSTFNKQYLHQQMHFTHYIRNFIAQNVPNSLFSPM